MPPPTTTTCRAFFSSAIVALLLGTGSVSPRRKRSSSSPTAPVQLPHPVVARVVAAMPATLSAPPRQAARIAALVTPLHLQTVATFLSGTAGAARRPPASPGGAPAAT